MTSQEIVTPATTPLPEVRSIGLADVKDALARGLDDFRAMPTHVIFLSLLYPVVGILIGRATLGYDVVPLLYPLAAGFALIGPFAAIGLYELSRRREEGLDTSWKHAFDVIHAPSFTAIVRLGLLLVAILIIWVGVAHTIYIANFGYGPAPGPVEFLRRVFTTPEGWNLIVVGNGVGFLFAVVVFMISAVSFPLLLDYNVSATAAAATSVRAVLKNPLTMALWAFIIAASLFIGSLPFFFGLAVVMPVLGHSSWHLYRKVVVPNPSPHEDYRAPAKPRRYAAEFPAALFTRAGEEDR